MLQRSIWSGLFLSAAVATAGFFGTSPVRGQTAPAAPAGPQVLKATDESTKLADDVLHYSLVNNIELTQASADKLLALNLSPEAMLRSFEGAQNGRDIRGTLLADLNRPELKDSLSKLLDRLDEGYRVVARDPLRIRADIDRLGSGPRAYQNAKDRLTAAGQFAVPIYLEYLQNNAKQELQPFIIRLMGEIGRPIVTPLVEELRVADPALRIQLVNVIGQIGYPQALPALRMLESDPKSSAQLKLAVQNAIGLIDRTGRAESLSAAELYVAGGENYYNKKASYQPQLDEKTNPIWYFDQGLNNVIAVQVPTEIWSDVMALRSAESAIKLDSANSAAISLWLAADLEREIKLPAGAADPSKPATAQDGAFYAKAAGPAYLNPVLARALDNKDAPLAIKAIDALQATGGVSGLVGGADSPLVRALSNPDRAVRFKAAFALAQANPNSQFPAFDRVVPVLCQAVSNSAAPAALLVIKDDDLRNAVSDALRSSDAHFVVYAGESITAALAQARRAPGIDVVIVPGEQDMDAIQSLGKTDPRFSGVPLLLAAKADALATLKLKYASNLDVAVIDDHADAAQITDALSKVRAELGATLLTADAANGFALQSLQLLDTLAGDHRSIFPVNEATTTLVDALHDKRPEVVSAAAGVLGRLNSPEGQRALAGVAIPAGTADTRVMFFQNLAQSAKRTTNVLDGSQIDAIIKIVLTDPDAKVRSAAAEALGALNVPSNQASTLILQQAR